MLPARHRLSAASEFKQAVRRGRRAGGHLVVVHLVDQNVDKTTSRSGGEPSRVGFVVARSVGSAVIRNRVKRRLRHLMRSRVDRLPSSSLVVVRALPPAAGAGYRDLEAELDRCLQRVSSS